MNELLETKLESLAVRKDFDGIKLLVEGLNKERVDNQSNEITTLKERLVAQVSKILNLKDQLTHHVFPIKFYF